MPEPQKVIITVQGGLIQHVEAPPGIITEVLDFDIEGQGDEDVCHCNLAEGGEAHLHNTFGEELPEG